MPIQLIISLVPLYDEPGSFRPVAPRAASLVPLLLYGEPGSLCPVRPFKAFADTVSFISVYEGLPGGPQIFCGGVVDDQSIRRSSDQTDSMKSTSFSLVLAGKRKLFQNSLPSYP